MHFGTGTSHAPANAGAGLFAGAAARWAPIPIRLIVGYGFAEHGFAKLLRGPDNFAGILASMGVPEPHFTSVLVIFFEIAGGLSILLGALVPLFAIPMIAILAFAALTVHLPYGFSSIKLLAVTPSGAQFGQPGFETDLLYLGGILALLIGGSGPLSFDRHGAALLARWRNAD